MLQLSPTYKDFLPEIQLLSNLKIMSTHYLIGDLETHPEPSQCRYIDFTHLYLFNCRNLFSTLNISMKSMRSLPKLGAHRYELPNIKCQSIPSTRNTSKLVQSGYLRQSIYSNLTKYMVQNISLEKEYDIL